jgi:ABC-2 type transport system ATP-binding protein
MSEHRRSPSDPRLERVASLREVSKRFGSTVALDGLDMEIRRGELVAMLGPNGAGKSTAISILLGLQRPDAGCATLFGRPPGLASVRRKIGVMMQEVGQPPEMRVRELIASVGSYYPTPLGVEETMRLAGVQAIAERRYDALSGGQKRQTQFALAICGGPQLLFLDEPTAHLDQDARELLWERVRELVDGGTTIVLTTHYIEEAEALAHRVVVVANGRCLASGTVQDMRNTVVRQRVECVTALAADDLRGWPEVQEAELVAGRLRATTDDAVGLVARLLSVDRSLRELEVRRASLAEALSLITGHSR